MLIATQLANAANVQVYFDQTEWANAVAAAGRTVVTEDFNDTTLNCSLTTITKNGHVDVASGSWNDRLIRFYATSSRFKLNPKVYAVGGFWRFIAGGDKYARIYINNGDEFSQDYFFNAPLDGFFGFISDQPFDTLGIWVSGRGGYNPPITYSLDYTLENLQYAETGTVSIQNSECGVSNSVIPNSNPVCTIQASVGFAVSNCSEGAKNHGQFVSCFTKNMNALKKEGALTDGDKGALTSCAAKAQIPEK